MKLGILTLPFNNNYGGYLQAYALMTVLKQEGHDVELIYRQHNKLKVPLVYYITNVVKRILHMPHGPFLLTRESLLRWKGKLMMPFVDKYIYPRTKPLQSTEELRDAVEQGIYDVIVCGSDQLWRPDYVPNIENFFCSFLKGNKPKLISYAASFGSDKPVYTEEQRIECGEAIARFAAVSVRERSGIDVIRNLGWKPKVSPQVVLDPTMLLTKEHYESLLPKTPSLSKGKVFCYVLDQSPHAQKLIIEVCEKTGLEPFHIIDPERWKRSDYLMPSIEDWLAGIRDAEYVVTDSFHGTVFSIIFNKPFVVYVNNDRGSDRFLTLLEYFNFVDVTNICGKINWNSVNEMLREQRVNSLDFLRSAIKTS